MTIPQPIKLSFDPAKESSDIQAIFEDRIARVLWMGIRTHHIVSQHFNPMILEVSAFYNTNGPISRGIVYRLPNTLSASLQ